MSSEATATHVEVDGDRDDEKSKDFDDADKDGRTTNKTRKSEEEEQTSESELSKTLTMVVGLTLLGTTTAVYYVDGHGLIDEDAKGTKLINAFYCAVMTLTTYVQNGIQYHLQTLKKGGREGRYWESMMLSFRVFFLFIVLLYCCY